MEIYYFTFGQSHITNAGIAMKDRWIKVIADSYGEARTKFIEQFTSINMDRDDRWGFQYKEKDFKSEYFPLGEYLIIE